MLFKNIFFVCYFGYQAVTIWDQVGPCVFPDTGNSSKNSNPSILSDFLLGGQIFLKRSLIDNSGEKSYQRSKSKPAIDKNTANPRSIDPEPLP